ncbi:MAG TPA: metallophosphoesterase [Iamia sp.]|jgi:predicted phosphodiesterase|nr:metallophosphoesterase [Iamia sp.]
MTTIPVESIGELTTVSSRYAVVHTGHEVRRYEDLEPDREHDIDGFAFRTLPEPGELLATVATVNDVHFGETVCGIIDGSDMGPTFSSAPGEPPYPEVMNGGAVAEIGALDPDAVIVKGDLTNGGTDGEVDAFLAAYASLADRMTWVRGNHESHKGLQRGAVPVQTVDLPGVRIVLLDTSVEGVENGGVDADQLAQLDALAAEADRPVLLMGHHHAWNPDSAERPESYFGINPDDSERLVEVVARRPRIVAQLAGHTHRNRVRRFAATGDVPWVEVSCVKDYPGAWAEYRVHEGGIVQVFHRISTPEALAWTEQTRHMYGGLYADYAFGTVADRNFLIPIERAAPT